MTDTNNVPAATPWYMSKTMWFGAAVAVLGVLDFLQTLPLPQGFSAVVGTIVMALRFVTASPLSK